MIDFICSLVYKSIKDPATTYEALIPILAFIFAGLWVPTSFALMFLFENKVLEAQLSLPYRILFFLAVLIIGLIADYLVCLSKHAKAVTYLNIQKIAQVFSIDEESLNIQTLSPEQAEQLFDNLNKNQEDNKQ